MRRHVHRTATVLLLLGCSARTPPVAPPPIPTAPPAPTPPPPDVEAYTLAITDLPRLQALSAQGMSLASVLGGEDGTLDVLAATSPTYQALSTSWAARIDAAAKAIDRPLVVEHRDAKAWPAGNVGRRFDTRWLRSSSARFDLIGVVNRLDRADFLPGTCGEVRLLYRLAYRSTVGDSTVSSRMPLTLNVVYTAPGGDCAAEARRWTTGEAPDLSRLTRRQIELNVQAVRFPSGVETEFAGQALYIQRVHDLRTSPPTPMPLENTPDVARLREDAALRASLREWVVAHGEAIDDGTVVVPPQFLATEAWSWSTLGVNRLANKPWTALWPDPPVSAERMERLDNLSCMGCHQTGSTAGFHFLGEEDPAVSGVTNRLQGAGSRHQRGDLPRRRAWLHAVGGGESPDRRRPHALAGGRTGRGAPCQPGGGLVPDCGPGLTCEILGADPRVPVQFGQCVAPADALAAGDPCRKGTITPRGGPTDPFNRDAWRDVFEQEQLYGLREDKVFHEDRYNCRPTVIGVPLGRAYRRCRASELSLAEVDETSADLCAVVGGSRFDKCVEEDFHTCLAGVVGRGMVDLCSASRSCREDYICQQLPWQLDGVPSEEGKRLTEAGIGFCTPTYFLFQLRLDGHPVPAL